LRLALLLSMPRSSDDEPHDVARRRTGRWGSRLALMSHPGQALRRWPPDLATTKRGPAYGDLEVPADLPFVANVIAPGDTTIRRKQSRKTR